jgi:hypothetical protein
MTQKRRTRAPKIQTTDYRQKQQNKTLPAISYTIRRARRYLYIYILLFI